MEKRQIADWHRAQIDRILKTTIVIPNEAWVLSIETAANAMERGWRALFLPRRAAQLVLARAMQTRKLEAEASGRWFIASLVESLATIRSLSRTRGSGVSVADYESARNRIFAHFSGPESSGASTELRRAADNFEAAMREKAAAKAAKERRLLESLLKGKPSP